MKPFKNFLLLLPIVLGSASLRPSETWETELCITIRDNGKQALLAYIGSVTGMYAISIGITG